MRIDAELYVRAALCAALTLAGAPAWSQSLKTWVDACEVADRDLHRLLQSEALIVHEAVITANDDGSYALAHQSYTHTGIQSPQPICTDSRFYGQPQVAGDNFRSAIQVGPDLVLTAWHNPVPSPPPVAVVFGLRYRKVNGQCIPPDFTHIPAHDVYWVEGVAADGSPNDFALFRLDRPRGGGFPRVRRTGWGQTGNRMTFISHPDRLATKVDIVGSLTGYASGWPQVQNLHGIIGSSGGMFYNRDQQFIETVARFGVGAFFVPDNSTDPPCYRVVHTSSASTSNVTVKEFAPRIPPFELLVNPLDPVLHVGPVGGPFTNPVTVRNVRVDAVSPAPVDYRLELPAVDELGPSLLVTTAAPQQGTLAPGGSFNVQETIDAAQAPCGVYERTYKVIDTTHAFTDVVRHRFEIGLDQCSLAGTEGSGRE